MLCNRQDQSKLWCSKHQDEETMYADTDWTIHNIAPTSKYFNRHLYLPSGQPLWSSGRSFWIRIQRARVRFSLVSTIEELLGRKNSGSGLEIREHCRRDPSRWPRGTLYPQKLALTSPTSGGSSVGTVHSRTQATEILIFIPLSEKTIKMVTCVI
jgi:hypothetical protein